MIPIFTPIFGNKGIAIPQLTLIGFLIIKLYKKRKTSRFSFIFVYLFLIMLISIACNSIIGNYSILNFLELYRPVLFYLSFSYGYFYFKENNILNLEKNIDFIVKLLIVGFLFYLFIPSIYNKIFINFTKPDNINRIRRLTLFFSNPYDLAYFLNFLIVFYILKLEKKLNPNKLFYLLMLFMMLLATESRTGVIILFVNISILLFFYVIKLKKIKLVKFIFSVLIGFIILIVTTILFNKYETILMEKYSYLTYGLISLFENGIEGTPSIRVRFEQYGLVFEALEKNFLFGSGVDKVQKVYTESMYSLYLYRYGILGFIYVVFILIVSIIEGRKGILNSLKVKNSNLYCISKGFFIVSLSNIICFLTNNYIDQIRTNFFFYFYLGFVCAMNKNLRSK